MNPFTALFRRWTVAPVVLGLAAACSGPSPEGGGSAEERPDPDDAFASVEQRLMEASTSRVDFRITARGAVEADLDGNLVLGEGGRARLESEGTFAGNEVSLLLVSDGRSMRLTNGSDTTEAPTPPALKEALVVGLTRMGVLHNLARLTELAPPDHADGGIREWVQAFDFRREERGSVGFDIRVAGEPTGSARLFMSPATELPGERRQTVRFPDADDAGGGTREMEVMELYEAISVGAGADADAFELD